MDYNHKHFIPKKNVIGFILRFNVRNYMLEKYIFTKLPFRIIWIESHPPYLYGTYFRNIPQDILNLHVIVSLLSLACYLIFI